MSRLLFLAWRLCSQKKTYVILYFVEKYVRLKWKKVKVNVIIPIIVEYARICLNVPK